MLPGAQHLCYIGILRNGPVMGLGQEQPGGPSGFRDLGVLRGFGIWGSFGVSEFGGPSGFRGLGVLRGFGEQPLQPLGFRA